MSEKNDICQSLGQHLEHLFAKESILLNELERYGPKFAYLLQLLRKQIHMDILKKSR